MKEKVINIPLSLVDEANDSRVQTSDDRVEFLCGLRLSGVDLHPIVVFEQGGRYIVRQGRHRRKTAIRLGDKTITAIVRPRGTVFNDLLDDLDSNLDGPLPPSPADMLHITQQLLQHSTPARILARQPLLKPYIKPAQDANSMVKKRAALEDVATGKYTLEYAARKHGVRASSLRTMMLRAEGEKPGDFKTGFAHLWKGHVNKLRGKRRVFSTAITEGKLTNAEVSDILDFEETLVREVQRNFEVFAQRMRENAGL